MTPAERRTGGVLAAIFGLRMLGLFLVLPVFSVLAAGLPGGDDIMLVGLALGAYGLTQAFLQIPFGLASDRWGRKPIIVAGLLIFAAGSFIAAAAPDIYWMIAGRVLQGAGAISAAVTALAADLTREQHRTKVMAMIGASIGIAVIDQFTVAHGSMQGITTIPIAEPTRFQTYVAIKNDKAPSLYAETFVALLRGGWLASAGGSAGGSGSTAAAGPQTGPPRQIASGTQSNLRMM